MFPPPDGGGTGGFGCWPEPPEAGGGTVGFDAGARTVGAGARDGAGAGGFGDTGLAVFVACLGLGRRFGALQAGIRRFGCLTCFGGVQRRLALLEARWAGA